MNKLSKATALVIFSLISKISLGADKTVFDGKYGVFIAVAMVVLLGVFLLLVRLDIKTRILKKKVEKK